MGGRERKNEKGRRGAEERSADVRGEVGRNEEMREAAGAGRVSAVDNVIGVRGRLFRR